MRVAGEMLYREMREIIAVSAHRLPVDKCFEIDTQWCRIRREDFVELVSLPSQTHVDLVSFAS